MALKTTLKKLKPSKSVLWFLAILLLNCNYYRCFSQITITDLKKYTQKDLEAYRTNPNTYNFWWHKNKVRELIENDTFPYFVDERNYKGIINYGVKFSSLNSRNFNYSENFVMHKLQVLITNCVYRTKDSILSVEGTISGGPDSNSLIGGKNNVDVFIGEVKDTVSALHFRNLPGLNPKEVFATYKGEQINEFVILDTFPSLYMKEYSHFNTNSGDIKTFKITGKIEKNTAIVFASINCFTEIFDIGSLIFSNNKTKLSSNFKSKPNDELEFKVIIKNNIQISNKDNIIEPETLSYFKTTEQAEDYILQRQYGKAKELYDNLFKDNKYMFARDMHNALRCSTIARDYNSVLFWSKKLALKGVDLSYFDAKIFDVVKKQNQWKLFLDEYSELNKTHKEGLNTTLINQLEELIEIDQKYYVKNSLGQIERSILTKTTEFVDGELIKLIKKEGFPTEEKIGVQMSADGMTIRRPKYFVLIAHSYQINSDKLSTIKRIRNVSANKLEYDAFRDNLELFLSSNSCFHIYKGNLYNNKTCIPLNKMQLQKIVYRFNNEHKFIINDGEYTVIPYEHKQEKDDEIFFKERFNFVMKLTDDWFFYEH